LLPVAVAFFVTEVFFVAEEDVVFRVVVEAEARRVVVLRVPLPSLAVFLALVERRPVVALVAVGAAFGAAPSSAAFLRVARRAPCAGFSSEVR
jgi:hypothetical protein